jgi:hypothetical protein
MVESKIDPLVNVVPVKKDKCVVDSFSFIFIFSFVAQFSNSQWSMDRSCNNECQCLGNGRND